MTEQERLAQAGAVALQLVALTFEMSQATMKFEHNDVVVKDTPIGNWTVEIKRVK